MLFGHQNDDASQTIQPTATTVGAGVNPLAVDPETGVSLPTAPPTPPSATSDAEEPSALNQPSSSDSDTTVTPPAPSTPLPPAPEPELEAETPESATSETGLTELPEPVSLPLPASAPSSTPSPAVSSSDLLTIKQQALEQLGPLVDQLDQTPEEKFRTTMMLIQSTDNPTRLQDAYSAAQQISDEKVRAQALLDVINEINYFTQKTGN